MDGIYIRLHHYPELVQGRRAFLKGCAKKRVGPQKTDGSLKGLALFGAMVYNGGDRVGFSSLSAAKMGSCLADEGESRG